MGLAQEPADLCCRRPASACRCPGARGCARRRRQRRRRAGPRPRPRCRGRQRPGRMDQARLRRHRAGQCEQPIAGRGGGFGQFHAAGAGQFVVQRHAGQMRADDHDGSQPLSGSGRGLPAGPRPCPCPCRRGGTVHRAGKGGQGASSLKEGPIKVTPAGRPDPAEAAGHRDGRQPQEIGEVGIAPELAVPGDRVGQHLGDRAGGGRGRQHQDVDRFSQTGATFWRRSRSGGRGR
jgi:hypothetical protein